MPRLFECCPPQFSAEIESLERTATDWDADPRAKLYPLFILKDICRRLETDPDQVSNQCLRWLFLQFSLVQQQSDKREHSKEFDRNQGKKLRSKREAGTGNKQSRVKQQIKEDLQRKKKKEQNETGAHI